MRFLSAFVLILAAVCVTIGGPTPRYVSGVEVATTLPKSNDTYGAWLSAKDGKYRDCHVYVQRDWAVIGYNRNDSDNFSAIAVAFNPNGTCTLQYRDEKGDAVHVALDPEKMQTRLRFFLESLRDDARLDSQ